MTVGDTWAWDGTSWHALTPSTSPSARHDATAVTDHVAGQILLFGGASLGTARGDTWTWDGATWLSLTTPSAPSARAGHAMAFRGTADGGDVVLFGGAANAGVADDTWRWDGATWSLLDASARGVIESAMVFDPHGDRLLRVGGRRDGVLEQDRFVLTAEGTWQLFEPPAVSIAFAQAFDPAGARMLAADHQGLHAVGFNHEPMSWPSPPGCSINRAPLVVDPNRRVVVVRCNNGVIELRDDGWSPLVAGPANDIVKLLWDPRAGRVLVVDQDGDLFHWNGTSFTLVAQPPVPIAGEATAVWDAHRQAVVIRSNDGILDWDGATWGFAPLPGFALEGMNYEPTVGAVFLLQDQRFHSWDGQSATPITSTFLFPFFGATDHRASHGWSRLTDLTLLRAPGEEACRALLDLDGDDLRGYDDPDCWGECTPYCPPGAPCDTAHPRVGDGVCDAFEDCHLSPGDCACEPICGDFQCDGEAGTCPGDCV